MGRKIDGAFVDILELVFTAGYLSRDRKLPYIQKAIGKVDLLKFLLQVAWEVKDLETKKYAAVSEPLHEISKMLVGWMRNVEARNASSAPT